MVLAGQLDSRNRVRGKVAGLNGRREQAVQPLAEDVLRGEADATPLEPREKRLD
jgi:hypothetical protein